LILYPENPNEQVYILPHRWWRIIGCINKIGGIVISLKKAMRNNAHTIQNLLERIIRNNSGRSLLVTGDGMGRYLVFAAVLRHLLSTGTCLFGRQVEN
jgi:hypothetical protein